MYDPGRGGGSGFLLADRINPMKKFIQILFYFLLIINQESLLRVFILYDKDRDGQTEGVGSGVPVWARRTGEELFNVTDTLSSANFSLGYGIWTIKASPAQTRPFFVWVCEEEKGIDKPQEFLIIECEEKFFIRFPFLDD